MEMWKWSACVLDSSAAIAIAVFFPCFKRYGKNIIRLATVCQYSSLLGIKKKSNTSLVKWQPSAGYQKSRQLCSRIICILLQGPCGQIEMGWSLLDLDCVAPWGQKFLDKELKEGSEGKIKKEKKKKINRRTQQLVMLKDEMKKGSALRIHWMDVCGANKRSQRLGEDENADGTAVFGLLKTPSKETSSTSLHR